ncbi:hypothetical protein [Promicromonospora sp. NPDC050249]
MSLRDLAALGELRAERIQSEGARSRVLVNGEVTLPDVLSVG